jgi:hypothetical protein
MSICNARYFVSRLAAGSVDRSPFMARADLPRIIAMLKKTMPRRRWVALLFGAIVLSGCALTPRRPPPPDLINDAAPEGFTPDIRILTVDRARFAQQSPIVISDIRRAAGNRPINILVLSGGGASGAFGAGALLGLTKAHARPQFELVTGVSAGALIAPFAFLGSDWDLQLRKVFSGGDIEHLQHSPTLGLLARVLFPLGTGRSSLAELVDHNVTDAMIDAVARKAAQGNKLFVATTDLDSQETMLWDMSAIALHGGRAAHDLFRKVLIASASIPGVFPPVLFHVRDGKQAYDEMHVDGDVTTPLFAAPLIAHILPWDIPELKGANLYVIVNGRMAMQPVETPVNTIKVMASSFSAQLTYKTRDALGLILDLTRRDHMNFLLTEIPVEYPFGNFLDFSRGHLNRLLDYGEGCAAQAQLWTTPEQSLRHNLSRYADEATMRTACPGASLQASR